MKTGPNLWVICSAVFVYSLIWVKERLSEYTYRQALHTGFFNQYAFFATHDGHSFRLLWVTFICWPLRLTALSAPKHISNAGCTCTTLNSGFYYFMNTSTCTKMCCKNVVKFQENIFMVCRYHLPVVWGQCLYPDKPVNQTASCPYVLTSFSGHLWSVKLRRHHGCYQATNMWGLFNTRVCLAQWFSGLYSLDFLLDSSAMPTASHLAQKPLLQCQLIISFKYFI